MRARSTVTDFGLTRSPPDLEKQARTIPSTYAFLTPFTGPTKPADWCHRHICDRRDSWGTHLTYATSPAHGALVVHQACLSLELPHTYTRHLRPADRPRGRLTDMRLWQMVVDCWVAATTGTNTPPRIQQRQLRFLAFYHVMNDVVAAAMEGAFKRLGARPGEVCVVRPGDGGAWDGNPFARCAARVARALEEREPGRGRVEARAYFRVPEDVGDGWLHMVVELRRGDDDGGWAFERDQAVFVGLGDESWSERGQDVVGLEDESGFEREQDALKVEGEPGFEREQDDSGLGDESDFEDGQDVVGLDNKPCFEREKHALDVQDVPGFERGQEDVVVLGDGPDFERQQHVVAREDGPGCEREADVGLADELGFDLLGL